MGQPTPNQPLFYISQEDSPAMYELGFERDGPYGPRLLIGIHQDVRETIDGFFGFVSGQNPRFKRVMYRIEDRPPFRVWGIDVPRICRRKFLWWGKIVDYEPAHNILAFLEVLFRALNRCILKTIESPRPQLMACYLDQNGLRVCLAKALTPWLEKQSTHLPEVEEMMSVACRWMDTTREHGQTTGYQVVVTGKPLFQLEIGQEQNWGLAPDGTCRQVLVPHGLESLERKLVMLTAVAALWDQAKSSF